MPDMREETLVDQGAIPPSDFHDKIERIGEISEFDIDTPSDFATRLQKATERLMISSTTIRAAAAALKVGHVVLQGPPGTGKSSLARALCDAFHVSAFPVTAHEDWTVFDVVGRLELRLHADRKEEIAPVNGYFTESVIRCANAVVKHFDDGDEPQAEWLLIDELNRAHMDRAFGELFTVLGTDSTLPVTLPHQREGNRNLVIPRRFRIIATLNSFDRQFVNSLSQAVRRRFTFVTVNIPAKRPDGVSWTTEATELPIAVKEYRTVLQRACARVARRESSIGTSSFENIETEMLRLLNGPLEPLMEKLFDLVERIRYSQSHELVPHLPIGTAQLIDTVELFLARLAQDEVVAEHAADVLDWAFSVKIVPLLEADVVSPDIIKVFANTLAAPFNGETRRELLEIAAAGMHFVE